MDKLDIILDTDIGADSDDIVALSLLLSFKRDNLCFFDTLTTATTREYAPRCAKALCEYFGVDDVCIGKMEMPGLEADKFDYYSKEVASLSKKEFKLFNAKDLLINKLNNAKTKVVIVCIGPLTNIARVYKENPSLFNDKVDSLYIMGCSFVNDHFEWNTQQDLESARYVYEKIPCRKYVCPSELGSKFKLGESVLNDRSSPIYLALLEFSKAKPTNKKEIIREGWDPITVYAAVAKKGLAVSKRGIIKINKNGESIFTQSENGNTFILEFESTAEIERIKKEINERIANRKEDIMETNKNANNDIKNKKQQEIEKRNNAKVNSLLFPGDSDNGNDGFITLHDVNKIYSNDVQAVFDFNLNIKKKEFIVFVGPSGCGKSTTLRMIAGLEEISGGELFIDGKYSNDISPKDRDIAMVFQNYALYPHMSVKDNLAFGLKIRKIPTLVTDKQGNPVKWIDANKVKELKKNLKDADYIIKASQKEINSYVKDSEKETKPDLKDVYKQKIEYYKDQIVLANKSKEETTKKLEIAQKEYVDKYVPMHLPKTEINERVKNAAKILEIEQYLNRKPKELSGGQRQRVALGRAIVRNSSAFLMDEPLSNLDAKLRVQMRSEIVSIHKQIGATTIYVTHDQTEAMTMADRIVVMKDGIIQQIGKPRDIYSSPKNLFVAQFIGAPAMNVFPVYLRNQTITLANNISLTLGKGFKDKVTKYYESEINRLNILCNNLDNLIKDESHPRHQIHLLAKEEALKLINEAQRKLSCEFNCLFGIRPEDISIVTNGSKADFKAKVELVELLGSEYYLHVSSNDLKFIIKCPSNIVVENGQEIMLSVNIDNAHIFDDNTTRAII